MKRFYLFYLCISFIYAFLGSCTKETSNLEDKPKEDESLYFNEGFKTDVNLYVTSSTEVTIDAPGIKITQKGGDRVVSLPLQQLFVIPNNSKIIGIGTGSDSIPSNLFISEDGRFKLNLDLSKGVLEVGSYFVLEDKHRKVAFYLQNGEKTTLSYLTFNIKALPKDSYYRLCDFDGTMWATIPTIPFKVTEEFADPLYQNLQDFYVVNSLPGSSFAIKTYNYYMDNRTDWVSRCIKPDSYTPSSYYYAGKDFCANKLGLSALDPGRTGRGFNEYAQRIQIGTKNGIIFSNHLGCNIFMASIYDNTKDDSKNIVAWHAGGNTGGYVIITDNGPQTWIMYSTSELRKIAMPFYPMLKVDDVIFK